MRVRLRPRHLPLAVKCQILFGVGAAVVIVAALWVQFQRMEQLTRELNVSAGHAVAFVELQRHLAGVDRADANDPNARLIGEARLAMLPDESFERAAWERFKARPTRAYFDQVKLEPVEEDSVRDRYLYAEPLRVVADCMRCHVAGGETTTAVPLAAARATTPLPATGIAGVISVDIPGQIKRQQVLLNRVFLVAAGLLAGVLAVVVLWFILTRLILRPMRVLQETAERVTAGDLNVRADISTGDEFEHLAQTFNRMLRGLTESNAQLAAANKLLDQRLTALEQVNVSLVETSRLKNEFLASVSHELRTPLNSILGFADLLRSSTPKNDAKAQRYLANIISSGTSLLDLINDLLDLAKIEAGRMELRPHEISIADLFEALAALLKPLLEKKKLELKIEVAAGVPIVRTDAAKLQQVLYNLLSNAIKFSPDGQSIELAAKVEGEFVVISVTDHGPGIDESNHETIFERFRQLDAGYSRKFGGTGLGLSISRQLIELLGGRIGVRSRLGEGATFRVELPIDIGQPARGE